MKDEKPANPRSEKASSLDMTPVSKGERVDVVDVLRGFALFGVLAFNMWFFSGARYELTAWTEILDRGIYLLTRLLIEAKFYSLFSLLFGWGMSVQMSRAEARGAKATTLLVRRLLVLLLFGTIHALLIWDGDILMLYAQMGLLLLFFRRRSDRTLLIASGLALLLSIVMRIPGEAMDAFREGYTNLTAFMRQQTIPLGVISTGSYWEITRYRAEQLLVDEANLLYYMGNVFAMFLLGLFLGRRRILHDIARHQRLILVVMFGGLILGLTFNAAFVAVVVGQSWVPPEYYDLLRVGFRTIGAPCLTLFYVCAIVLLFQVPAWRKRLAPLANLGRMAFTNYILHSVIATLIFYNYGLGLFGRTDPTFALILTVLIYLGQMRFSAWWLARYQIGPLEWLWRTLTYGRRPPFHVGETSEDLRPLRWVERLRSWWKGANPRRILALAWAGLAIWALLLVLWSLRLQRGIPTITLATSGTEDEVEATPGEQPADAGDQAQIPGIEQLIIDPEAYQPGPIAAFGNLLDLTETFDVGEAYLRIEELVGPSHLGRLAGSPQGRAAAEYIAARFAEYGLQPAGDDGTFFQEFPVPYSILSGVPSMTSFSADGALIGDYEIYQDFTPLVRDYAGPGRGSGETAWIDECEHDDFDGLDVVDGVVICHYISITDQTRQALEHGAAALLLLIDPQERALDFAIPLRDAWLELPLPTFWVSPEVVGDLLQGSGRSLDTLPMDSTPGALATTVSFAVDVAHEEACPGGVCFGRNVMGVLPGRDPQYADEIVIIGGHFDHMGQGPDGTVWLGANDDASGVAVLLEMARSWHEQGYVPRRTVLFAAWDAEEQGLLGSRHYIAYPRFPLENTLAMLQLDMVAIGGETLFVSGDGLDDELVAAAEAYAHDVEFFPAAGSDHAPFLEAGVPAAMLSWSTGERIDETYHRTGDIPAAIEMEYLEWSGKISELVVLGIADAEPALQDLISARQNALTSGDLEAFLATSAEDLRAADTLWFEDYQALSASGIELSIDDVTLSGASATGEVRFTLSFESAGEQVQPPPVALTSSMLARFEYDGQWRFAGPHLTSWEADPELGQPGSTFTVAYPADVEFEASAFAQQVAAAYAETAGLLGLAETPAVEFILLPDAQTLRASTGLSLSNTGLFWIGPGSLKMVFSDRIAESENLGIALSRLLLAEAGVNEAAVPWLWRGLSSALASGSERTALNSTYQPQLQRALMEGEDIQADVAAWAAVEYLRRQLGWEGLGSLIGDLGRTCAYQCETAEGADAALMRAIGMEAEAFEAAWKSDWSTRLETAQQAIDRVLSARQAAILSGNLDAFLATVDPSFPDLNAEERLWFEELEDFQINQLTMSGEPVALLDGGQVLAEVLVEYSLLQGGQVELNGRSELTVLFTSGAQGLQWSGVWFEELPGERVRVLYPSGAQESAQVVLEQAQAILQALDGRLGLLLPSEVVIKLYGSEQEFRQSIMLVFPAASRLSGWTEAGTSLKLLDWEDIEAETLHPTLTTLLMRHVLAERGVTSEWLLKGLSVYLASEIDGGATGRRMAQQLTDLLSSLEAQSLSGLTEMLKDQEMPAGQRELAYAHAWDSVRYLIETYGEYAMRTLLASQSAGIALEQAFEPPIGIPLASFESEWAQSLALGHARPEWVELAMRFNAMEAQDNITYLASRAFMGRQAGTSGSEQAAQYIAQQFAAYGLLPVGDLPTEGVEQTEAAFNLQEDQLLSRSYLQRFPINFSTLILNPQLLAIREQSQTTETFIYQRDFVLVPEVVGSGGDVRGELIWVRDGTYEGMNLEGAIVVRQPYNPLVDEVTRAVEHGASGLILVGSIGEDQALAKAAIPQEPLLEASIPVLELTEEGFERLLQITGHTRHNLDTSPAALSLEVQVQMQVLLSQPRIVDSANVLGLLPGSDPELADEVIIIGAHYDHVGDDPGVEYCMEVLPAVGSLPEEVLCGVPSGRRYPGANDNASGVAVMLEIARLWQDKGYQPGRSVLFAAWGAQEIGQVGSNFYVQNPVYPLESTVALLQLDAVGGGSGYYLEANFDWEREAELIFIMTRAEEAVDGRLARVTTVEVGDHTPFREAGIPTLPLAWRGASEDNLPQGFDDEIEIFRLSVTGRMVTLALMALAR